MAKRNQESVMSARKERKDVKGYQPKEKFTEQRRDQVNQRPLVAMNELQKHYIDSCRSKDIVLAIGYAGSSKTYIPTRIAIEKFLLGEIKNICIVRPAVSESKGLGFYAGDKVTKCKNWIMPVLDIFNEFLGASFVDYLIEQDVIRPLPLETIKGMSLKDSFIIVDESEDLTVKEFVKCVTRIGENSTMVFAGDIMQVDIKGDSGLAVGFDMAQEDNNLNWATVNFDRPSDIVRSQAAKDAILALRRKGLI